MQPGPDFLQDRFDSYGGKTRQIAIPFFLQ